MLTHRIPALAASIVISASMIALTPMTAVATPRGCGGFDVVTGDYVACASTGSQTASDASETQSTPPNSASGDYDPCYYSWLESPPPDDPLWSEYLPAGADPAGYRLQVAHCEADARGTLIIPVPIGDAQPPDPGVVGQEAIARLPIPLPDIHVGPDVHKVAVNVPVWLWVSDPGAPSASQVERSAGVTVSVTAHAALSSVTWSMGEPSAGLVTCHGAGVAPQAGVDLWDPPCGYTYQLRPLPERTGGAGAWTVTVTATWAIDWHANTGASGTDTATTTATLPLHVGEYRTVLVNGG